jgi:hypothetical protein
MHLFGVPGGDRSGRVQFWWVPLAVRRQPPSCSLRRVTHERLPPRYLDIHRHGGALVLSGPGRLLRGSQEAPEVLVEDTCSCKQALEIGSCYRESVVSPSGA